ncbi:indole-3-acetic acid inducible 9 [Actinidia rufa]|uniref:Indole-3-acetic acid inducible 9 n=1 Tax=Actinidia rufa TaxID=165716 RepID=A0A7J0EV08_9ERIC|nr:indole-3-acetic acid inducible 9 [Actinidia rufa]
MLTLTKRVSGPGFTSPSSLFFRVLANVFILEGGVLLLLLEALISAWFVPLYPAHGDCGLSTEIVVQKESAAEAVVVECYFAAVAAAATTTAFRNSKGPGFLYSFHYTVMPGRRKKRTSSEAASSIAESSSTKEKTTLTYLDLHGATGQLTCRQHLEEYHQQNL